MATSILFVGGLIAEDILNYGGQASFSSFSRFFKHFQHSQASAAAKKTARGRITWAFSTSAVYFFFSLHQPPSIEQLGCKRSVRCGLAETYHRFTRQFSFSRPGSQNSSFVSVWQGVATDQLRTLNRLSFVLTAELIFVPLTSLAI